MSFRCDGCRMSQAPRTKMTRVPIRWREKEYSLENFTSVGWEIVEEKSLCPPCVQEAK